MGLIGVAINDSIVVLAAIRGNEAARSGDLDEIYRGADQHIFDRLLLPTSAGEILELYPNLFIHAGLMRLHELAQDAEGLASEAGLFDAAVRNWHLTYSAGKRLSVDPWSYHDGT